MVKSKPTFKDWLSAFRLRTLPLAFSSVITGSALAHQQDKFNWVIFSLALSTTLFLQVLSNLANDYGDAEKGTDNENRIGPKRAIQSGAISKEQMKKGIVVFVILSLVSGLTLVFYATRKLPIWMPIVFVSIGLLSIVAAIKYTAGKGAYGYKGLGDLFVFVFFGLVGVLGSFVLYHTQLELKHFLPAISIGLFSSAVLNLNNMRDWENDKASGKNTLVVKIGLTKAKKYHSLILITGMLCTILFFGNEEFKIIKLLFLFSFFPLIKHLVRIVSIKNPKGFDPELKKVALSTFMFSILFFLSVSL